VPPNLTECDRGSGFFTEQEAAALARELFGVERVAVSVASERDQAFLIEENV